MKFSNNLFLILLTLSTFSCSSSSPLFLSQDNSNSIKSQSTKRTTTGNIKYKTVKSNFLESKSRNIVVYLPPSYDKNKTKRYPVLYVQDGQNIFDKSTGAFGKEWYVDEKVQYLIEKNVIEEIIVVGVYNGLGSRLDEYTWTSNSEYGGGKGKNYSNFFTKELKPLVDNSFRTKTDRNNTAVMGSSLGGLISFYLASENKTVFSKVGLMSPSFWWNDGESINKAKLLDGSFSAWIDYGNQENELIQKYTKQMTGALNKSIGKNNVFSYSHKGAKHNEESWAIRVHAPIIQFFGKEKNQQKKFDLIKRLMSFEEWSKL